MPSIFCLTFLSLAAAPMPAAAPDADQDQIRAVLRTQQEAWNRGDLTAFMQAYENTDNIRFVGRAGITRGYAATDARYRKTYATRAAMGTLAFSDLEFEPLGKGHLLVVGKFALARTAEGGGNASGWYTLIFKKTKQGWKVIHDHTS